MPGRLARIAEESVTRRPGAYPDLVLREHPDYASLSDDERLWLHSLFNDPAKWNDGDDGLTNGRHRLCALRAAGVQRCPVEGTFLPAAGYGDPVDAQEHARRTVGRERQASTCLTGK